jgi:CheY-like chemotaxis protein
VAAWDAEVWDVIVMDIQMPELDGIAATKIIRRAEDLSGRRRTPIIALSANVMAHQIAEYVEAGMDGHIAKPIDVRKLFSAIEQAVADANDEPQPASRAEG